MMLWAVQMYKFVEKFNQSVNFNAVHAETIKKLIESDLSAADIWSGSIKAAKVKVKERKAVLDHIKTELETIQSGICAYCGFSFDYRVGTRAKRNVHREHIAPKHEHRGFTFESMNIVLSCSICNSLDLKGTVNTIVKFEPNYINCTFNIIHPFIDKRSDHFELESDTGILQIKNNSSKAIFTRDTFKLNDPFHLINRSHFLRINQNQPIPPEIKKEISKNILSN